MSFYVIICLYVSSIKTPSLPWMVVSSVHLVFESSRVGSIQESIGFMSVCQECVHIVVVTLGKFWSFGNPDSRTVMAAQPIWVVFFHCTFCHLIGTSLVVWLVICTYYVMMHSNNEVVNFVFYYYF